MALTITETSDNIAINGWIESVIISKTNINTANGTLPVVTIGNKFRINGNEFCSFVGSSGTSYPKTWGSVTSVSGNDYYGVYLDVTITFTATLGAVDAQQSIRLRFYEGKFVFDIKLLTNGSWSGFSYTILALSYTSSQSKWFTTLYRYGWEANGGGQDAYGDWSSIWKAETNPMDLSSFPITGIWGTPTCPTITSGQYGLPYVSEEVGGIGHYIEPELTGVTYPASYESIWTYQTNTSKMTIKSGQVFAGFCLTTIGGYQGLLEYAKWQNRGRSVRLSAVSDGARKIPHAMESKLPSPTYDQVSSTTLRNADMNLIKSQNLPIGAIEQDWGTYGHVDHQGDWNLLSQFTGVAQEIKTNGYIPGIWLSARVATNASVVSTLPVDSFVRETGGVLKSYPYGVEGNEYMWDHTTTNGQNAITSLADKIWNLGFRYTRWDVQRNEMWREFGVLKVFAERIRYQATLAGELFVIETEQPYLQTLSDTMRTNDWFGFGTGWDTALQRRLKVALCSCPHCVIDTDALGNNGGSTSDRPLNNLQKQARLMFSVGRPIIYGLGELQLKTGYADPLIQSYMHNYDILPAEIPTREIINGWDAGFSIKITYSNGTYIYYDSATDSIDFVYPIVFHNVINNFTTFLSAPITTTNQVTMTLMTTLSISPPYYLTIGTDPLNSTSQCEIVEVINNNSGTLTINRAQQGTTAQTFSKGIQVQLMITAKTMNEIYFAINSSPMFPQNMLINLDGLTISNFIVTRVPVLLGTVILA